MEGSLLERIQNWRRGETFEDICRKYEQHVLRNYAPDTTVVFNGGYDVASTKDTRHLRRCKMKKRKQVKFTPKMKLSMRKDQ